MFNITIQIRLNIYINIRGFIFILSTIFGANLISNGLQIDKLNTRSLCSGSNPALAIHYGLIVMLVEQGPNNCLALNVG